MLQFSLHAKNIWASFINNLSTRYCKDYTGLPLDYINGEDELQDLFKMAS